MDPGSIFRSVGTRSPRTKPTPRAPGYSAAGSGISARRQYHDLASNPIKSHCWLWQGAENRLEGPAKKENEPRYRNARAPSCVSSKIRNPLRKHSWRSEAGNAREGSVKSGRTRMHDDEQCSTKIWLCEVEGKNKKEKDRERNSRMAMR